jgi:hypothetical protein
VLFNSSRVLSCVQVRREVHALLERHRGVLKPEHFDSGVICHLQKRAEGAAVAALREIGRRTDFTSANNKPAYLTHWLMKLASSDDGGVVSAQLSSCASSLACTRLAHDSHLLAATGRPTQREVRCQPAGTRGVLNSIMTLRCFDRRPMASRSR